MAIGLCESQRTVYGLHYGIRTNSYQVYGVTYVQLYGVGSKVYRTSTVFTGHETVSSRSVSICCSVAPLHPGRNFVTIPIDRGILAFRACSSNEHLFFYTFVLSRHNIIMVPPCHLPLGLGAWCITENPLLEISGHIFAKLASSFILPMNSHPIHNFLSYLFFCRYPPIL